MVKLARWPLLLLSLLLIAGAVPPAHPGTTPGIYVLDSRPGRTLVMQLPSLELALQSGTGQTSLGVTALSARFLPDGDIAFIDLNLALRRLGPRGPEDWLPPGSANAPLFVSPDGQQLAYLKPINLAPGENEAATNGIAVLDMVSGEERLLLQVPDVTVRLYGWVGRQLLVEVPTWSPTTRASAGQLALGLLNTDGPQAAPTAIANLPALLPGAHYPQTSLDQRYLAYQSTRGLIVASLSTGRYGLIGQAGDPQWTAAGLTGLLDGQRASLGWSEAALTELSPASGPVALPAAQAANIQSQSQAAPAAPSTILFFRPVKASTPVSAYMDLDFNVGTIADWTGWTGTHWAWGHAYDQHKGTDYAGSLGDPVYAAAPGTVDRVVIDCVNTYPGGPGSFGSYVRIDHGLQSDGAHYETLYGHFKCDAVYATVGEVINTLPTQLAQMGNTGWSSGVHTHLQVYKDGTTIDPYQAQIISDNPPLSTVGSLSGAVRDVSGQPVPGVTVKVASGGLLQSSVTDGNGQYSFSGVRLGAVTPTAAQGARWGTAAANIQPAQNVVAPDIVLDQCGGTTTSVDGCPAVNFDAADFLADVTVPDTGVVAPSQALTKIWRVGNSGSSAWGAGYQLVFIGGSALDGAPSAVDVPPTGPNSTVEVSLHFTSAAGAGLQRSYWRLRSPAGVYFGPLLWAQVNVQPPGAGLTLTVTPPSPASSTLVHIEAQADGVANFRAQRLLIDGAVVTQTNAVDFGYDWPTTGLDTIEHSLVLQAADQSDAAWLHPQQQFVNYALQGPPVVETPIDHDALPAASQPAAPGTVPACAVQSLPAINATSPFTVTWAGGGGLYDVQFMDSGRSIWRDWLHGVGLTAASFSGQLGHRYGFRCRATDTAGNVGSYPSAADAATLLGAQSGPTDLALLNLVATPNPSGGVLAQVVIQNDSTLSTQRGFYVDLYEDHLPGGVGDFAGSVQVWAVAPLDAGRTITLSAVVPQASGEHTAALFAQADSTGVIDESNEGNNVWSSGTGACVAAPDAYENDNTPSAAKLLPSGQSQDHVIGGPGDQDWMLLDAQPGQRYQYSTSNLATGVDTRLTVYGPDGVTPLASNDDGDGTSLASQLTWIPPAPGPYYLVTDDWNPGFGGCGAGYTVSAQDLGPGWLTFIPLINR